jgi:carbonic anhydrase
MVRAPPLPPTGDVPVVTAPVWRSAPGWRTPPHGREHAGVDQTDDLLANNLRYAQEQFPGMRPLRPARAMAIVACMDSRMDLFDMLGLANGDAHVIRNAGGVVTDDVIRSLVLSQRAMGTTTIVLVHHTDCGLSKVSEDELRQQLETETGMRPTWAFDSFRDPFADVQQSIRRLRATPFLLATEDIRGFVYDVETGRLNEVQPDQRRP